MPRKKTTTTTTTQSSPADPYDVFAPELLLDLEEEGKVPVFDTCNEVRRKMRLFLKQPGVTQAGLARALGKCRPGGRPLTSSSIAAFLAQKGPSGGSGSAVFYAGYVFFEKQRLKMGKPKTQLRLEMERVWGGFVDRHTGARGFQMGKRGSYWVSAGRSVVEDKYGWVRVV